MIPALIVPILTGPELLYRMLSSVDYPVGTLVVIDNGGVVDPGQLPRIAKRQCVLDLPNNLGVSSSWNLGIKATPFAPWWLIVNHDVTFPAGSLSGFDQDDSPRVLRLADSPQPFSAFALGDKVVQSVGLFDEYLHPAYYEDTDYQRRCQAAGVPILTSMVRIHHDNSSTLSSGYRGVNEATFARNAEYHAAKTYRGDLSEGNWSLRRRREQTWD